VPPIPPDAPRHMPDDQPASPRERLRRARENMHPGSDWREVLTTALEAMDEPTQARSRALWWLHHALSAQLPAEPRRDSIEQRVLRGAASAIEDELEAEEELSLRVA
jgi:hypothetical protein